MTTEDLPAGLHERGRALWLALGVAEASASGAVALEACRIADRLDELDRVIAGKGVLNLMSFRLSLDLEDEVTGDREIHVKVEFSNVLAEARQQAATLTTLLTKLGLDKAPVVPAGEGASPLAQVIALVRASSEPAGGAG